MLLLDKTTGTSATKRLAVAVNTKKCLSQIETSFWSSDTCHLDKTRVKNLTYKDINEYCSIYQSLLLFGKVPHLFNELY
jgi:hypothetical protein